MAGYTECAGQDQAGPNWIADFLRASVRMFPVTFLSPLLSPLPAVQLLNHSHPDHGAVNIKIRFGLSTSKFCPELRPGPASLVGPRGPKRSFELGLAPWGPTRYLWLLCAFELYMLRVRIIMLLM